ncbi:MAG: UDP-N-acetylmuramoyl-L-alanyl-D-glutamate--2,6-diaminopimelate ligase [Rhodoblastus sp.]|nr:UDP-N-acetylmuramoyl-L-alanyl-D-glutamate--2,6-diaminopimelate ligase [Rhodoblastus sp.]MCO5086517.1 UDP-N-acetylmuramoyl-L-alanyl-D-glutamate--2,6-diaminopimelate ligase [Methylobacteriaceae bacterium]
MRLDALIAEAAEGPQAALEITALAADSRKVVRGTLFFAVPGTQADGLDFAPDAISRGAVAVVAARAPEKPLGAPVVVVPDVRLALSRAAARFHPLQPATIAAVTGTSGKTSIAAFLRQIWLYCGRQAASMGTIGIVAPSGAVYGSLTTPDSITLHETLQKLAQDGVTHLAMEASSHGLDQRRLDGVRLSAAAFTNLSRDHLDYHATLEEYLAAKLRLFEALLQPGQPAVIDADTDVADRVIAACAARGLDVRTIGRKGAAIRLLERSAEGFATRLMLECEGKVFRVLLPLAGEFQTSNALVAAGLAIATGETPQNVFAALEKLVGAPGRIEKIGDRNGGAAFVDYAHKPGALETAISALRPFARGKLIVVFGCGGDRDRGKRPIMGEISARLADVTIVTDDNPRSEQPDAIRAAILEGARAYKGADVREIGDRAAAIAAGVALLGPGDVLLVAGKGHETGQIIGSNTIPFSDHEAVRTALEGEA